MSQTAMSLACLLCKMIWKGGVGNPRQTSSALIGNLLTLLLMCMVLYLLKLLGQKTTSKRGKVKG